MDKFRYDLPENQKADEMMREEKLAASAHLIENGTKVSPALEGAEPLNGLAEEEEEELSDE